MFSYLGFCSMLIGATLVIVAAATRESTRKYLVEKNFLPLFGLGFASTLAVSGQQSVWYDRLAVESKIVPSEVESLRAQVRALNAENDKLTLELRPQSVVITHRYLPTLGWNQTPVLTLDEQRAGVCYPPSPRVIDLSDLADLSDLDAVALERCIHFPGGKFCW